jgi:hypothetical protein
MNSQSTARGRRCGARGRGGLRRVLALDGGRHRRRNGNGRGLRRRGSSGLGLDWRSRGSRSRFAVLGIDVHGLRLVGIALVLRTLGASDFACRFICAESRSVRKVAASTDIRRERKEEQTARQKNAPSTSDGSGTTAAEASGLRFRAVTKQVHERVKHSMRSRHREEGANELRFHKRKAAQTFRREKRWMQGSGCVRDTMHGGRR